MLIRGDARHLPLIDGCVQTCITSPPYFGLRQYPDPKQIGLEPTPDDYIAQLVAVAREVRRVLKDDGTFWLNLGDGYAAGGKGGGGSFMAERKDAAWQSRSAVNGWRSAPEGMKAKDLMGIPWMVAFALRADGWYLRSDIIWAKPNPMPESVTDRPTKSHEYLFLLTKSAKYYYDAAAIYEPYAESTLREADEGYDGLGLKDYAGAGVQNPSDTKRRIIDGIKRKNEQSGDRRKEGFNDRWDARTNLHRNAAADAEASGRAGYQQATGAGRNKRTVWTIPTQPVTDAHFATFPEALVEPCILAGAPMGGLVLDPFTGTGTVGVVAARLGRRFVGVDLSYQDLAARRTAQRGLPLLSA